MARKLTLAVLWLGLAVIGLGWGLHSARLITPAAALLTFGRLAGLVATYAALLEFVTMSRAPFIEQNFNLQDLVKFHRRAGYTILVLITIHVLFITLGYNLNAWNGVVNQFVQLNVHYLFVFRATLGAIIFVVATLLSNRIARRRLPYELWFATHLTVYAGILLIFGHQINNGGDFITQSWFKDYWWALYLATGGLLLFYRVLRPLWYEVRYGFRVARIVPEADKTFSVYLRGRQLSRFNLQPGQYAIWRFLAPGLWWESHPFSFSLPSGGEQLRLSFKATGDFTERLGRSLRPGTAVLLDGPRGHFTARRARTKRVLLIAGGIGITPFMAMLPELIRAGKHIRLVFAARDEASVAFREELQRFGGQVSTEYYITAAKRLVDRRALEKALAGHLGSTTVFICGPEAMAAAMQDHLLSIGVSKERIITERFAF